METTLVTMEFGSHVYGTSLPTSDRDYKSVFVPSGRDILLGRQTKVSRSTSTKPDGAAKNTADDVDVESFSYSGFLKLLAEGQTVATDMLFVPERHWTSKPNPRWMEVVDLRGSLVSRQISGFVGYCKAQANKYGIKGSRMSAAKAAIDLLASFHPGDRLESHLSALEDFCSAYDHAEMEEITHPSTGRKLQHLSVCNRKQAVTVRVGYALGEYQHLWNQYGERARQAARNEGIDWKALMHAVRICKQADELLRSGTVTFPRPEADLLLRIRKGEMGYSEVAEIIEEGMLGLEDAQRESILPEKPDRSLIEDLIVDAYGEAVRCS